MIKILLLLSVIVLLSYFIVNYYFLLTHTIFVNKNVKYPISDIDKMYIKKNKIPFNKEKYGIFYTDTPWNSTTHFNYLLYKKKYYIIEPGYYYIFKENVELFIKNYANVIFMEMDFKKNKK